MKKIVSILVVSLFAISAFSEDTADAGVKLETGGLQIALPQGWEVLNQSTNFFVQQRARNLERNYALSAGTFKSDLAIDKYVALALAGFESGPEPHFEKLSKVTGVSVTDIENMLQSQIGRQELQVIKQAYRSNRFEVLDARRIEVSGVAAYELHLKMTILATGGILYTRQFTFAGASPGEIVNITFVGPENIFQDNSLANAILKTDVVQHPEISEISGSGSDSAVIDRKTFSVSLPNGWKERTTDKLYNPDSFVCFIGPRSCLFKVEIGKNSPGISIDRLLEYEVKVFQKDFTGATTSTIAKWANFDGKGLEIEGTTKKMTRDRLSLFAFENADNVCIITEIGKLEDLNEYAGDFEKIRQTFRLK